MTSLRARYMDGARLRYFHRRNCRFGLWFRLIAHCTMARVAPFALLSGCALISSVLFRSDRLTPTLAIGALRK